MQEQVYENGWEGLTRKDWNEMYNTNSAQYPTWVKVSTGLGFDAPATLKANGIDPNNVPDVFKEYHVIRDIMLEVEKKMPVHYILTP